MSACEGPSPIAGVPTDIAATVRLDVDARTPSDAPFVGRRTIPVPMAMPTYDGSGEAVHPDVVAFSEPWHGYRLWNAVTPYPNSATRFENPSIFGSDDGRNWRVPSAGRNPLVSTTRGHLSDPDMIFERRRGELWLYYREVELAQAKGAAHVADYVWRTTSTDGVNWSVPKTVVTDLGRYVVSPSIVQNPSGDFSMYSVDAGTGGCNSSSTSLRVRRSSDGVEWSAPEAVRFQQPGFLPWHLDVQYVASRGEYWALITAYQAKKGCHRSSLFLATSRDGIQWTAYPRAVLSPSEFGAFSTSVYRSTFAFEGSDNLTMWFSGARTLRAGAKRRPPVLAWSLATTRTTGEAVLSHVADVNGAPRLSIVSGSDVRTPQPIIP